MPGGYTERTDNDERSTASMARRSVSDPLAGMTTFRPNG